jgi:cell division protein FtsW (lipid II flippase)
MYAVLGLALLVALTNFDYRLLRPFAVPLFGLNLGLLAVVLLLGRSVYGAQRWINVECFRYNRRSRRSCCW